MAVDPWGARGNLATASGQLIIWRLCILEKHGIVRLDRLPFCLRVLLESVLRRIDGKTVSESDVAALAAWQPVAETRPGIPFHPVRVLLQDFTGLPALVDLAAMRSAMARLGGDPQRINPLLPVDLVIDHSVQVDFFASPEALRRNAEVEFQRNRERYEFLRWGQARFEGLRVVPPATGIVHQVNLEVLAQVVVRGDSPRGATAYPDSLVGTDSHTTMINGLGVLGWGVGGIEAAAAMLGQPLALPAPDVIGVRLIGEVREGVTATDLALTITQILRRHGVVEKFVEFTGPSLAGLSLPDRATIANMAPEYGATIGFFPVDDETLRYLRLTGRPPEVLDRVERYCKEQGLYRHPEAPEPEFSQAIEVDLAQCEASVAGPRRPHDRLPLAEVGHSFRRTLTEAREQSGYGLTAEAAARTARIGTNGGSMELAHGAVVIAAITSCTNTSNPSLMITAGLLARRAVERGLTVRPHVKTSLAPGSRVVTEYLTHAGLAEPLAALGFNVVGYGCTTCIGNSGPLAGDVVKAITESDLVVSAVLSGNRNFEGRIHPHVRASYLASPPLVIAFALAGTVDIDLQHDPLGSDREGRPVFLRELWPSPQEIDESMRAHVSAETFRQRARDVFTSNPAWGAIRVAGGSLYTWDPASTYIQEPPFFQEMTPEPPDVQEIRGARILAWLGDSVTTDHISPAGAIPAESPAGEFLLQQGVSPRDFNSYGSRRGNDRVMTRGTFANIRLRNRLVPEKEGGWTLHVPSGRCMSVFAAAEEYASQGVPLVVIAGKEYGTGSSRDSAAKGTRLLGVRAVIAESFERIHRANLVGMGVLPLQFQPGQSAAGLGLTGSELIHVSSLPEAVSPGALLDVHAERPDGTTLVFAVRVRIDTPAETDYYRHGGVLPFILRRMLSA
jgi:aconitate hydratase